MEYQQSNRNVQIPCMLYGTAWKKERTADLVEMALHNGFRGIDTACQPKHYEEALVGEGISRFYALGGKREELFIQTKFTPLNGQDPMRVPYDPKATLEEQILYSCEVSKRNLRTTYLDSLLLHSPLFPYANLLKAWKSFESLIEQGEVRQIGISNCYDVTLLQHLFADATIKPSVVQNRFYQESDYDKMLRAWCNEIGIIYQSFWSLTANPHILQSDIMHVIARHYQKSTEQIFYRYLIHKDIIPLNGTTSQEHMKEDLSVFSFELDKKVIERIDTLLI